MPLSADAQARSRQVANLKQNNPALSRTHGAQSEQAIRPLRERYLAELAEEFPHASPRTLVIQAARLAKLELLERFVDERGVIRHQRRGDIFPAVQMAEQISRGYLQTQERLEAERREREYAAGDTLDSIAAEYEAKHLAEGNGDGS
jgi:hypothetical protein